MQKNVIILLENDLEKRKDELSELEKKERTLEKDLEKIKTAKAYKLWQIINKPKKLFKLTLSLSLFYRTFIAIIYIIIFFFFFFFSTLFNLFSLFFSKKLTITEKQKNLDGVSFIIPTWNKKNMVLDCIQILDSLLFNEKKIVNKEIIIIENGSSDGTLKSLRKLKTKIPLTILAQEENLGFAKAINKGLKKAKFNYVYLMNNDMRPKEGFFNSLIEQAKILINNKQNFFAIASQIFFFDTTKRREESGKTYSLPNRGFIKIAHYIHPKSLEEFSFTLYPGGGSSLINKHIMLKLGGYDQAVYKPLYCEDLDMGFMAWKYGFPSYFDPNSQIIHYHRSSSKKLLKDPSFYMYKNWLFFILKNTNSITNILKHLIEYPVNIILVKNHDKFALEAIASFKTILKSKIKLFKYKTINSDKELLNFVKFEANQQ